MSVGVGLSLIAAAVLITLTAIGVWRLGTWIGFFLVYNWVFNQVTNYGVNTYVARIASILFGCVVWFGAVYLWKKHRRWGIGSVVALLILQSTFLFFAERNRYFSVQSGEPSKYYTINPITKAIQVFDQPVFDAFGQKATSVTFEVAKRLEYQRLSEKLPNEEVPANKIKNFFDPYTGAPLVFYSQDDSGKIRLYLLDGYDSKTGAKLQPVTATIVSQATAQSASVAPTTPPSSPSAVQPRASTTTAPPVAAVSTPKLTWNLVLPPGQWGINSSFGGKEQSYPGPFTGTVRFPSARTGEVKIQLTSGQTVTAWRSATPSDQSTISWEGDMKEPPGHVSMKDSDILRLPVEGRKGETEILYGYEFKRGFDVGEMWANLTDDSKGRRHIESVQFCYWSAVPLKVKWVGLSSYASEYLLKLTPKNLVLEPGLGGMYHTCNIGSVDFDTWAGGTVDVTVQLVLPDGQTRKATWFIGPYGMGSWGGDLG